MNIIKPNSLERYISISLIFFSTGILLLAGLWGWSKDIELVYLLVGLTLLAWLLIAISKRIYCKVLSAFVRASLHLDAINQEDFNQYAKSPFSKGKVNEFHQQLNSLSEKLQRQKSRYDQQVFVVYQLIEQLDTPIIVFNEKKQLTFGNAAFQQLFGQPWQMLRHASPKLLGLEYQNSIGEWHFNASSKQKENEPEWQIRQSEFIDAGETHQLLVFINIGTALRESQLNAWQQIIRVLGHEIRNSLTPVSSLAESLSAKESCKRDKQALGVITERCQHLQDFVERYSSLSKKLQLSPQWIRVTELTDRVVGLFNEVELTINSQMKTIWVDGAFFEQVLINLIKNSIEADASEISVDFSQTTNQKNSDNSTSAVITITDNGHGFTNLENLFIPLYSTKEKGQGIGLSFCRNIIEQHHGVIELTNNTKLGVIVHIQLPLPPAH